MAAPRCAAIPESEIHMGTGLSGAGHTHIPCRKRQNARDKLPCAGVYRAVPKIAVSAFLFGEPAVLDGAEQASEHPLLELYADNGGLGRFVGFLLGFQRFHLHFLL